MPHLDTIKNKIYLLKELENQVNSWKEAGETIGFTNGCFDILHKGHIEVLSQTADLCNKLIIGLNSDQSIQDIKGGSRPIISANSRAVLLASLSFIDAVVLFSEKTPLNLINSLKPDVLTKGGDYEIEDVVGHKVVQENGGQVFLIPFVDGFSSSLIIDKIRKY